MLGAACWVGKLMNYSPCLFYDEQWPCFAEKCVCGSCHRWPAAVSMGWRKSGFTPCMNPLLIAEALAENILGGKSGGDSAGWVCSVALAEIRDGHHEMGPGLGTEQQGVQVLTISFHLVPILNRKQWQLPPKVVIAEMTSNSYNQGRGWSCLPLKMQYVTECSWS